MARGYGTVEADLACEFSLTAQLSLQLLPVGQRAPSKLTKFSPGGIQDNAAPVTVKQWLADLLLQAGDGSADRRDAHVEVFSGTTKVKGLCHREKDRKGSGYP